MALLAMPAAATQQGFYDTTQDRGDSEQRFDRGSQDKDLSMAPNLRKFSKLRDSEVVGRNGEEIGQFEDLVVNIGTGELHYAVVSSGGFLGIGGENYAVPANALSWSPQEERLRLNMSKDELEGHYELQDTWPARFSADRAIGNLERERDVVRLSKLEGKNVHDQSRREIGEVDEIVMNVERGEISYVVVTHEELEDGGSARFAVPLKALQPMQDGEGVMVQAGRQDFSRRDSLSQGNWPAQATTLVYLIEMPQSGRQQDWQRQQDQRYGQEPYQRTGQQDWQARGDQQRYGQDPFGRQQGQQGQQDWRRQQDQRYGQDPFQRSGQQDWRQSQSGGMHGQGMQDPTLTVALTEAETKTIRGRIQSVRQEQGNSLVQVQTLDNETITVLLAPQDFLRQEGIQIRQGEQISLTGKQVFVPTRLQKDNQVVQLRDQRGQPQWREDGMDFDRARPREAGFGRGSQQDGLSHHLMGSRSEQFSGQVADLTHRTIQQDRYVVLVLRDQRGSTREVALLPQNQLSANDLNVTPGGEASVEAARANVDGREIWIAKSIDINGRRMNLRQDSQGSQGYNPYQQQQGYGQQDQNRMNQDRMNSDRMNQDRRNQDFFDRR